MPGEDRRCVGCHESRTGIGAARLGQNPTVAEQKGPEAFTMAISDRLEPLMRLSRQFTMGGKRLRPAFCFWGRVAAAGFPEDPAPLLRAAASLDLLRAEISRRGGGGPRAYRSREQQNAGYEGHGLEFGTGGSRKSLGPSH